METNLLLQQILTVLLVFLALFLSGRYVWKHFFSRAKTKNGTSCNKGCGCGKCEGNLNLR